jgi:TM2 domain-containing membrane protein YozV
LRLNRNFELSPRQIVCSQEDDEDASAALVVVLVHAVALILLLYCCCGRGQKPSAGVEAAPLEPEHLQPKKRLMTSYVLWLLCGMFGAHHFYLDRLVHGLLCLWTGNIFGLGWFLDAVLMPYYIRSFNSRRCAPTAPYDVSGRRLLCLPLVALALLLLVLVTALCFPYVLHGTGIIDLDQLAAQTKANPYDTLGVPRTAGLREAKMAYRKASLRWHPDRNPGCGSECEERMSEVSKAHELIKRRRAPPAPDRTWREFTQDVGQDWWMVLEVFVSREDPASAANGHSTARSDL